MRERPRLLFLAYYFPPVEVIAAVRTRCMAKYLSRLGWNVTVVTPDPSLFVIADGGAQPAEELMEQDIERMITGHRWGFLTEGQGRLRYRDRGLARLVGGACRKVARCFDVNPAVGWKAPVERACASLRPGDVDLVLATGNPFIAFELAGRLAARLDCPYVFDYRDPWTVGNAYPVRTRRTVRKEQRLLEGCAAAMIVSPSFARAIAEAFGVGAKMHVVSNGYDPEELAAVLPHGFDHFAIIYTGHFYTIYRNVSPLMTALRLLIDCGEELPPWRFHYYGAQEAHVRDAARQAGVDTHVVVHGKVLRSQALSAIKGAGVAVVISSVAEVATLVDQGMVTGKIFEPIGMGITTLLVAPPGSDAEEIVERAGNGRRFVASDVEGMASFLSNAMRGVVPPAKNPALYAWPTIVKQLDRILRGAAGMFP